MPALLRRLIVVLLLFASAFGVAACETSDSGPLDTLRAMPESHLDPYPGATLLREGGHPRYSGFLEPTTAAAVLRWFGTDADFRTVADYYHASLKPLGWSGCCGSWRKGGSMLSIRYENPLALPSAEQGYKLVYYESLEEYIGVESPPPASAP